MNESEKENRLKIARRILEFWTLFIGLGAVAGSIGMLVDISGNAIGMKELLPYFQVLPFSEVLFQDFLFSGIMLLIVNGITNLTAYVFLFNQKKTGYILGTIFGGTLMAWIIIQFVIFPVNFMDIAYFIFGALQFITGWVCLAFYRQTQFKKEEKEEFSSSDILVVYFSRMGYTEKLAYRLAIENKAEIEELKTKEKTQGTMGFWWCGRFAMHRWAMPIEKPIHNLSEYKKVIVVSPIWVFSICAPVRDFLQKYGKEIKNIQLVTNCFGIVNHKLVKKECENYKKEEISYQFFSSPFGNSKEIK